MRSLTVPALLLLLAVPAAAVEEGWRKDPWRDTLTKRIESEFKAYAVEWGQEISLWIWMAPNGEERAGLAYVACEMARAEGAPRNYLLSIRVLDATKRALGEHRVMGKWLCQI